MTGKIFLVIALFSTCLVDSGGVIAATIAWGAGVSR